jgi:hypothetical protein
MKKPAVRRASVIGCVGGGRWSEWDIVTFRVVNLAGLALGALHAKSNRVKHLFQRFSVYSAEVNVVQVGAGVFPYDLHKPF